MTRRDKSQRNQRLAGSPTRLVEDVAPGLAPTVKWGQGGWTLDGAPKVFIHAEPDYLQFGFFAGARLGDPLGLLYSKGKHERHVKVFRPADIQADAQRASGLSRY